MYPLKVLATMIDKIREEVGMKPSYVNFLEKYDEKIPEEIMVGILENAYSVHCTYLTRYRVDILTDAGSGEVLVSAVDANKAMHHAIKHVHDLGRKVLGALCTEKHKIEDEK